jgi:hypothetical protein
MQLYKTLLHSLLYPYGSIIFNTLLTGWFFNQIPPVTGLLNTLNVQPHTYSYLGFDTVDTLLSPRLKTLQYW